MLKNGYYLSAYISINKLSFLTDFALRGDQNLSLWKIQDNQVELVHYWELERETGIKGHDFSFYDLDQAKNFINGLLSEYDLSLHDMVEIWGNPLLDTCQDYHSILEYPEVSYHSVCHIFSAILMDSEKFFNSDILAFAVDGGPDSVVDRASSKKNYYCGCYSQRGKIVSVFPVCSPGPMWAASNRLFDLREGTLMALASATISELKGLPFEFGYAKDIDSASNVTDELHTYYNLLNQALDENWDQYVTNFDQRFSKRENIISMFMKEINKQSIKIMEKEIDSAIQTYQIDCAKTNFAMSGGFGLNCPTNSYLMNKYRFQEFIAPPGINDAGISLGIALYAIFKRMDGKPFSFKFKNAFYGDRDQISEEELRERYGHFINSIQILNYEKVVDDIVQGPVIWFQGAAEVGPRALGHRSIIGDPSKLETKDLLNKIKQRQWWRPVAPILIEEAMNEWFEDGYPSPYMLHTFKIKKEKNSIVPAITHHDRSCRVQTITEDTDPVLYHVLKEMNKRFGIPLLCNTSLNDKGEPIINRIDEAMNFGLRKGIKIIYINTWRVELINHDDYKMKSAAKRKYADLTAMEPNEMKRMMDEINPHQAPKDQLAVYLYSPEIQAQIDLKNKRDIRNLKFMTDVARKRHPSINYGVVEGGCR